MWDQELEEKEDGRYLVPSSLVLCVLENYKQWYMPG